MKKGYKFPTYRKQWNYGMCNKIVVICAYCKKEVKKYPNEAKKSKRNFCNYQCFYNWLKGRKLSRETIAKLRKNNPCYKKGKNNPFWKNGVTYSKKLRKIQTKKYRQEHKKELTKSRKKYYRENIDKIKRYFFINKEKISKQRKQYYKRYIKTPEGILSSRISQHNRRHKIRMIGRLLLNTVQLVYEDNIKKYGKLTCMLCNNPINFGEDSIEHKYPICRGGTNDYDNLGVSHKSCNISKGRKTVEEYLKWKETVCQ